MNIKFHLQSNIISAQIMDFYQNRNLIIRGESDNIGNLWLGDYQSAKNKRTLKSDKINTVVTAGLGMKISYNSEVKHKILPLYDSQIQNIARYFQSSYQFIEEGLKSGNVLIHCYAGVSRSTTILAAYLMKKNQWRHKQTLALIRKQRRVICPNKGFLSQLKKFQSNIENGVQFSKQKQQSKDSIIKPSHRAFVQGFLDYKRDKSVVYKGKGFIGTKNLPLQRSKTINKQIAS